MKILAKCNPSFVIHIECMNALKPVEELNQLNLDNTHDASDTSRPIAGGGDRVGGR